MLAISNVSEAADWSSGHTYELSRADKASEFSATLERVPFLENQFDGVGASRREDVSVNTSVEDVVCVKIVVDKVGGLERSVDVRWGETLDLWDSPSHVLQEDLNFWLTRDEQYYLRSGEVQLWEDRAVLSDSEANLRI